MNEAGTRAAHGSTILLHEGPTIAAKHLGLSASAAVAPVHVASGGARVDFSVGGIQLDTVERQFILKALQASSWNRGRAAQLLGISKETLRYRMEKYQMHAPA
jgi:DNA-binding NtrC family response regulator